VLQLCDALVDLAAATSEQVEHVGAGRLATVPVGADLPDLAEAQAECLTGADEPEPFDRVGSVVPVLRRGAAWLSENPDLFVVADRLYRDPGSCGDLSDAHFFMIPLDSPLDWRVYHRGGSSPSVLTRPVSSGT